MLGGVKDDACMVLQLKSEENDMWQKERSFSHRERRSGGPGSSESLTCGPALERRPATGSGGAVGLLSHRQLC